MKVIRRSTHRVLWFCTSFSLATIAIYGPASAQTPPAIEFKAVASSYVESQYANTNFGISPILEVGNNATPPIGDAEWTYVKFDLSKYTGPILSATLEVYGHHTGNSTSDVDTAYGVPNNSWTQLGLTWNNKPALGSSLSKATITTVNQYYAFDVTAFLKSSSTTSRIYSLAILPELIPNGSVGPDIFQSINAQPIGDVNPPVLIINGNIP
jgi:hypothetical protein